MQVDSGFKGQRTVQFAAPTSGIISLPVEPFGATQGQTRTIVNLRLTKAFTFSRSRLALNADVFNLFNTNVDWGQNLVSGPTFGYVTALPDPRVLRIGASYEF
jgi:outer membrane receptor protein involved in Fe transport